MTMVLILLSIPVLCVSLSLYVMSLYNLAISGNMTDPLMLMSLLFSIIFSFISIHLIVKNLPVSAKLLNFKNRVISVIGYISIILFTLFGVSLFINMMITEFDVMKFFISIGTILLFTYATYIMFIYKEVKVFNLFSIEKEGKVYLLSFSSDDDEIAEVYVNSKKEYKENKNYSVLYNKYMKLIVKIKNEVIDIK